MKNGPLECLEAARDALAGSPARALSLLPARRNLPAALRPERDFVAAESLRMTGYFDRAEKIYARIFRCRVSGEDPVLAVEAALGSASGLRSLGRIKPARRRLSSARAWAKAAKLSIYTKNIELEEALIDRAAGLHDRSLRRLQPLLRRASARNDWAAAAFLLWAIGGAERLRGRLAASEEAFRRSLSLARRAGDPIGAGYARFGLGGVSRIRGKLSESERHYAAAAGFFRGSDDLFGQAYALCGRANALRQLGRLASAATLYRRSHRLYSRIGDRVDLAYVDWGLGEIELRQGRLAPAVSRLRAAWNAFRAGRESRGEVLASLSLARALHAQGKTGLAEKLWASAHQISRQAGLHAHLEGFT